MSEERLYKQGEGYQLGLLVDRPTGAERRRSPGALVLHSGGWTHGTPEGYQRIAEALLELGYVTCRPSYRLLDAPGRTVWDCVHDARSAMRYVRSHAEELAIDADHLIVCGGSAGGHLAMSLFFDGAEYDDADEDNSISCQAEAVVLFNPVIDCSADGFGQARCGVDWERLSPLHQVRPGLPPTIVFHGTGDKTTPFIGAEQFVAAMHEAGNVCEFHPHPDGDHGYYREEPLFSEAFATIDTFLHAHLN